MHKLKKLREEKGMTLNQFAKLLGVGKSMVMRWESGAEIPRAYMLIKLSNTLKCPIAELLD